MKKTGIFRCWKKSLDRSLERLQTETVDLLQLHSCSMDILKQGDVISFLQRAKAAGKTRFIGYSGDNEAAFYAATCGAFDTLQTSVNIADQMVIDKTLPAAVENNIGVIAKRPIANAAWTSGDTPPANAYAHDYWERLRALEYSFLSGPDAVRKALRFTLALPGVCTAIVGTQNPDRWAQNAALLDAGALSGEEVEAIRARWQEISTPDWTGRT